MVYKIQFRNQSQMPLIQEDLGMQLQRVTLISSRPVDKDVRFTDRHLAQVTNLGLASGYFIVKKMLKVTKISVRWILHLLIDEQKLIRVQMAKQLLKKYQTYQKKVFDSLITGDETWVHFYEPKRKVYCRIWALKHAKRPSIAKRILTAKNVLYAIFSRHSGPLVQISYSKR